MAEIIIGVLIAGFLLLIALWLLLAAAGLVLGASELVLPGALSLLGFASEQGFIGIAIYIAMWVFLWPLMLAASVVLSLIAMLGSQDT